MRCARRGRTPVAARVEAGEQVAARRLRDRAAVDRRDPDLEREHEPLGTSAPRSAPRPRTSTSTRPGRSAPLERRRRAASPRLRAARARGRGGGETMRSVRSRRARRAPGMSRPAGGWKWMPLGAGSCDLAGEGARRRRRSARENARENAATRAVAGGGRRLRRRRGAGAQLPGRPLEQQPPAQRDGRLAGRRGEQPVQVVAREVRRARPAPRRRAGSSSESSTRSMRSRRRSASHPRVDRFRRARWTRGGPRANVRAMPSWSAFQHAAPELAARGARAPRRPRPQDARHGARGRLAAHLRHRDPVRGRRAVDRLDVGGAQGARPAARSALRAAQRLRRPARAGAATRSSPAWPRRSPTRRDWRR